MEICELCKVKLVDFYHFKNRSKQVRKLQTEINEHSQEKLQELDFLIEDKTVYNTLQIVRNYIEKYSVAEIKEDENEQRLIIIPKNENSVEPEKLNEQREPEKNELIDVSSIQDYEEVKQEELEPEYLEDCLDDLIADDDEICDEEYYEIKDLNQDQILQAEQNHSIADDDEYITNYDEDSETSYDLQQSASESASDSRKPSNPRRPRRPENWICNKRKTLRNSGQTYLSSKGKIVEAKQMRESCGTSCRAKCITKVSDADRQRAFDKYWALGDVVKQRKFIYMHIRSTEPKRRRTETSNRSVTLQFYLETTDDYANAQLVQVCKKMFKNTLVISSQVIQGVVKKYAIEGFIDTRGKFERKLTEAQKFAVEHVKRFPFFYIEQTMTKVQCYQLYRDECLEKGIDPVKEGNYRDIFDKQNQGSFLKTEKISCEICHRYYKATDEERIDLQKEHDSHISLGVNKKCRDRALGRIRHKRAMDRKRAQRMALKDEQKATD
jgi:hypothetical protein